MKINLVDLNKFIEVNTCPEVSNPVFLDNTGVPTTDGMFSYEMFGIGGSYDRKTIFGFIDLKQHFLHPVVYKIMVSSDKRIASVVDGSKTFVINGRGELVEDENGENGVEWLYKNYDKIKWKKNDSRLRNERIEVLKTLKKNEAFVDKWLVIPPYVMCNAAYRSNTIWKNFLNCWKPFIEHQV